MPLLPGANIFLHLFEAHRSNIHTVAFYGREVPCGGGRVPASADFPATVRDYPLLSFTQIGLTTSFWLGALTDKET
jgi:hypothetical protein